MIVSVLQNLAGKILFEKENILFLFSVLLAYSCILIGLQGMREKKTAVPLLLSSLAGLTGCAWFDDASIHIVGVYLRLFALVLSVFTAGRWMIENYPGFQEKNFDNSVLGLLLYPLSAAPLGALCGYWFSLDAKICGVIWILLSMLFYSMRSRTSKKSRKFNTYEDIYQRSNPDQKESSNTGLSVRITFFLTRMVCYLYLGWRLFFTLPFGKGWIAMLLAAVLLFFEALGVVEYVIGFDIVSHQKNYPLPNVDPETLPDVDVFIATYNEDPKLLYKTVTGALHMDYPDRNKVHIYLCDDGRRKEVQKLAGKLHVGYITRDTNAGAKAGNLNNALSKTASPYVVTFDADMIANHSFLMETMPYFADAEAKNKGLAEEEKIEMGFIQTPQTFYNPDLFQQNLLSRKRVSNEQDYFYRCIESAKTRSNSVIYGGSNTVLSRKALEEVGGFYTEAITEDFATGLLIQKKGYVSLGLSTPLASGLNPEDFPGLVSQRVRWGRGVINLFHQVKMLDDPALSLAQKLNYFISIIYWLSPLKRAAFICIPIFSALFQIPVVNCNLEQVLFFWLPMTLLTVFSFRKISGKIRTSGWSNLYETILFPFLLFPIVCELLGFSLKKFHVTSKDGTNNKNLVFRYFLPHLVLIVLSTGAIVSCLKDLIFWHMSGAGVTLFWLLYNLLQMVLAVLFMAGSVAHAYEGAQVVELEGAILQAGFWQSVRIVSISDTVACFQSEEPFYIPRDQPFSLVVQDLKVQKEGWKPVKLEVISKEVVQTKEGYIFECEITGFEDYDSFLRCLYDRPVESVEMDSKSTLTACLIHILFQRIVRRFARRHIQPAVKVNRRIRLENDDKSVFVRSFSWNTLSLAGFSLPERISFHLVKDSSFILQAEKEKSRLFSSTYRVKNLDELLKNPDEYEKHLRAVNKKILQKKKTGGFSFRQKAADAAR